jgi:hypothetical protein
MMPVIQINLLLYKTEAGKNRVGNKWKMKRERERETERQRDRETERQRDRQTDRQTDRQRQMGED